MQASRAATDSGNAISRADALAARRIAVGLNPNPDPDGTGPKTAPAISPYQIRAADVNGSGTVTSADALAILRMTVKLSTALPQEWFFVEEKRDFWDEANQKFTLSRTSANWDRTITADPANGPVNLVGVLKGDVNGSWTPPAGSQDLDVLDPTHFQRLNLAMEEPLVVTLKRNGYDSAEAPVYIQSFEVDNLKTLSKLTPLRLVQLLWVEGQPYDQQVLGSGLGYQQMITPQGLEAIARYASGIGPEKGMMIPRDAAGNLTTPTSLVRLAQLSHATVVPMITRLTPDGYVSTFYPGWRYEEGESVTDAVAAMNRQIEAWIREDPSQYLWTHRRFKTRPAGVPSVYS